MNIMTQPDKWVIIKIDNGTPGEEVYKVYGSWMGGYLDGDAWRLNSGITKVGFDEDMFIFTGYSGSSYHCYYKSYGVGTSYTSGVLDSIIKRGEEAGYTITIMPEDTDWLNLLK